MKERSENWNAKLKVLSVSSWGSRRRIREWGAAVLKGTVSETDT